MSRSRSDAAAIGRSGLCIVALLLCWQFGSAADDVGRGGNLFKSECGECHSSRAGKNKKGPSLFGIVGRKAATMDGVEYSDALKATGWTWDDARLDGYLSGPVSRTNPGGKMKYDGLADPRARADLLAYLATLK